MRLFVAVEVDDQVRAWAGLVRRAVERDRPAAASGLRWVAIEQLHLTLRFIGEVDDTRAASIRDAFAARVRGRAFPMALGGLRWLPSGGRPRVLVSPVGAGAEQLEALRAAVDAMLHEVAGMGAEDRPLLPHLTLARVRDRGAAQVVPARFEILKAGGDEATSVIEVTRLTLFHSVLSPRGPTHSVLAHAPLAPRETPP